jgi:hypothetical protein
VAVVVALTTLPITVLAVQVVVEQVQIQRQ